MNKNLNISDDKKSEDQPEKKRDDEVTPADPQLRKQPEVREPPEKVVPIKG
ncbi:MAG: hypothetical protein H7061_01840 [Bdellovibrionaceae bacterium]|nr:hypothetical protein [Bdellovibrio sp.]